jgi:hypothetical protein
MASWAAMGGIGDWQSEAFDDHLASLGFKRHAREYRRVRGEFHQIFHIQVSNTVGVTGSPASAIHGRDGARRDHAQIACEPAPVGQL